MPDHICYLLQVARFSCKDIGPTQKKTLAFENLPSADDQLRLSTATHESLTGAPVYLLIRERVSQQVNHIPGFAKEKGPSQNEI
jgi:hypothetical protein